MLSPHQPIASTLSGRPSSFSSTNSLPAHLCVFHQQLVKTRPDATVTRLQGGLTPGWLCQTVRTPHQLGVPTTLRVVFISFPYDGLGCHHDCREGLTIVVGQDEAPLGGDAQHGPALIEGELVGPAGAPSLAGQLEGGDMVSVHALIRQAEQEPLRPPSLQQLSYLTSSAALQHAATSLSSRGHLF